MKRTIAFVHALGLSLALAALPAPARAAVGIVPAVADGDTLEIDVEGRTLRVDLAGVDCPEKYQDFGADARRATLERTLRSGPHFGRSVRPQLHPPLPLLQDLPQGQGVRELLHQPQLHLPQGPRLRLQRLRSVLMGGHGGHISLMKGAFQAMRGATRS